MTVTFRKSTKKKSDALPSIHHQIRPIDKPALITRQVQAHIGDILNIAQPTKRDILDELGAVLGGIFHAGEHGEEPGGREKRANVVDADVVLAEFGGQTFGCLPGSRQSG